jgi:ABC-type multidrug transport system fused ATPase/permease subunit
MYSRLNRVRASVHRLMDIEQVPDALPENPAARPLSAPPRVLSCDNVSFGYEPVIETLRGIGLTFHAGERVALVGASGGGKSSLLKLIPRLYDPTGGCIALDGCDIRSLPLRDLRRTISVVPQDPMLFCGTIRENVRLGSLEATADELTQAAEIAGLTDVIQKLPAGWDTMLGPMGAGLSGGEKQRLAIARALVQRRPILVLDEATSALDAASEDRLLARLEPWCAGRTVIVVSHRPAVARWADRIVVLSDGKVIEDGSHDLLYRPGTCYYTLWQHRQKLEPAACAEGLSA